MGWRVPQRAHGLRRLGVAACIGLAGCSSGSATLELRLAHSGSPVSLIGLSADEFARRANGRLGDRATVVVFGSSLLGGDEVVLQKLKLGTVDMSVTSTVLSSIVDALALFEMPYLVKDRRHMRRIENELFWATLEPRVEEEGYRVLAVWENGFRHITNNTRPIVTPADLRGLKLRTPRSPWRVKVFQTYGANPSPLSYSEVFIALQTGVMDGQENPLSNIVTSRLHEVQEYLSLTGHVYSPAYLTVAGERWARLPDDVREILETTARATQEFVLTKAEAFYESDCQGQTSSALIGRRSFSWQSAPPFLRATSGASGYAGQSSSASFTSIRLPIRRNTCKRRWSREANHSSI